MADIRIVFPARSAASAFQLAMSAQAEAARAAIRGAVADAAAEIKTRGAADIAGAGKFGKRWTEGLQADVVEDGGSIQIQVSHAEPLFPVFAEGRTIRGKPMLWIPLPFAKDAQGVRARDYGKPLFRVDRKSGKAPLLFAFTPGGGRSAPAFPVYFGKASVTIPRKFNISRIVADVSARLGELYRARREAA